MLATDTNFSRLTGNIENNEVPRCKLHHRHRIPYNYFWDTDKTLNHVADRQFKLISYGTEFTLKNSTLVLPITGQSKTDSDNTDTSKTSSKSKILQNLGDDCPELSLEKTNRETFYRTATCVLTCTESRSSEATDICTPAIRIPTNRIHRRSGRGVPC